MQRESDASLDATKQTIHPETALEGYRTGLRWQRARALLLEAIAPVGEEIVPLAQAGGRILSQGLTATQDDPPFDRSPYDGYAFRSADTGDAPVTLHILEEIPAGSVPHCTVTPGTAAKILTGAPIPPGADAVSKFEETTFTPETVTLHRSFRSGENIVRRGESLSVGTPLASAGKRLNPGLLGALAAQGFAAVPVYRRPVVGVLTIGSELLSPEQAAQPGRIFDSNRWMIAQAVEQTGCRAKCYESPLDDRAAIASAVQTALAECDALVTTGGVSVGDYDLTAAAFLDAGAELLCGDLRLKPGGKSCFGRRDGKPILGLSGNPASALTCFYAVAQPVLLHLGGRRDVEAQRLWARLDQDCANPGKLPRLVRGWLHLDEQGISFTLAKQQSNGGLLSMGEANALAELLPGQGKLERGSRVEVLLLNPY
jgi:molybdopterin molybdotransferase